MTRGLLAADLEVPAMDEDTAAGGAQDAGGL